MVINCSFLVDCSFFKGVNISERCVDDTKMNSKLQHKDVRMTPVYSDDGDGDNENESGSENEQEEQEEDNDADNDEAEPEEEGGKNGHKASSDEEESSEEEGSGSEDSSDMDVEECEKKRFEFLGDLTELEAQFAILREQLYRERLTQIETKQEEVKTGLATEYIQPLDELQENLRVQLDVGLVLRRLRQENIECKYDAEQLAANQNYLSEKSLAYDTIKADLEDKIRRLEEDKHNVDFSTGLWEQVRLHTANNCSSSILCTSFQLNTLNPDQDIL